MSINPLEDEARAWWKDQQANFPDNLLSEPDKARLANDLAQLLDISVAEALTYAPDYVPPETPKTEEKKKEGATMATEQPSMSDVIRRNLEKTSGEIHKILNDMGIEHSKSSISSMLTTARRKAEEAANEAPAKKKPGPKPKEAKPAPAAVLEVPAPPAPQPKKAGNLAKVIEAKKELIAQLEEEVRILQKAQDILEAS